MTTKKAAQKSTTEKSKSAAKKSTKKTSPILKKGKEVVGEILTGAATGAALSALNVVVDAIGTAEKPQTPKATGNKSEVKGKSTAKSASGTTSKRKPAAAKSKTQKVDKTAGKSK
jgi:hypothetical protein